MQLYVKLLHTGSNMKCNYASKVKQEEKIMERQVKIEQVESGMRHDFYLFYRK